MPLSQWFLHQFHHLTSLQLWPGGEIHQLNLTESPGPMKLKMGSNPPKSNGLTVEEKVVLQDS